MNTQRLTKADAALAAEILRQGGLVGIPTETVYGLGANGLDPEAVSHILQAKPSPGQPSDLTYPGSLLAGAIARKFP